MAVIYFKTTNNSSIDNIEFIKFFGNFVAKKGNFLCLTGDFLDGHQLYELSDNGHVERIAWMGNQYLPEWLRIRGIDIKDVKTLAELNAESPIDSFFFI